MAQDPTCCSTPNITWYKNKILIVSLILLAVILLSFIFYGLEPFRHVLFMYLQRAWWAITLGLFIGGMLDYYIPKEYFSYLLANPKKSSIFYSVVLGFFMSVCSHGILAIAIELHKKGASTSSVISFLLASPWANMMITFLLVSFFGVAKTLYIILVAIIIAMTTGFIFQIFEKTGWIERNKNTVNVTEKFFIIDDFKKRRLNYSLSWGQFRKDIKGIASGALVLADMVVWWTLVGIGVASFLGSYVPPEIFKEYLGPTAMGLTVTLILATVLEVCSEGSAPVAFEIFRQTGALGNSFIFLMAGVVTDYTEIGLLWHNVGRRTAISLPLITVPQVILFGILANIIF